MQPDSVLITGGAGFIGRWLVSHCLKEGLRVAVYDDLSVGRLENIAPFRSKIKFYRADILDTHALMSAIEEARPQVLVHLAARHFIPFCNQHPQETMRINVDGTYSVLSAAARSGVETTVVASSGVVYASKESPLCEDDLPDIRDVYGLSKLLSEEVAHYFACTTEMKCFVARLFNTYGPCETNPHLIPHIVASLKETSRVELGNTTTKRDYVYVEDVAELLLKLSGIHETNYSIVNIGTGCEYSAREIVDELNDLLNSPIEIVVASERTRKTDKMHQLADITKLVRLTGGRPHHSLKEGLRKLLVAEGLLRA